MPAPLFAHSYDPTDDDAALLRADADDYDLAARAAESQGLQEEAVTLAAHARRQRRAADALGLMEQARAAHPFVVCVAAGNDAESRERGLWYLARGLRLLGTDATR